MSSSQRAVRPEDPAAPGSPELRARLSRFDWYHTQELAPGVVTPGMFDLRPYVDRYGLPDDLTGLRALDVGTFEGFWAFEMERRGAQVIALDVDRTEDLDWPPRLRPSEGGRRGEGFEVARAALGSSVERVGLSIYHAEPERLGMFDLVFCGSVLVHLRDPMLALERMAALCRGRLVLADEYSRPLSLVPLLRLAEFRAETPWMTWWRPSAGTLVAMVRCAGFEDARLVRRFVLRFRGRRKGVPHAVIHARGPAG